MSKKLETATQKVVRVAAEGGRSVWSNLLLISFAGFFVGLGISLFLSVGLTGKILIGIGVAILAVLAWFFLRPVKDSTPQWRYDSVTKQGYWTTTDQEEESPK